MKLFRVYAIIGCLPAVALAEPQIMMDQEMNGLDVRAWVMVPELTPNEVPPLRLRLTNHEDITVYCEMEPEPAEDPWTYFPEAAIEPGGEAVLPIGGDYSTETIRVKVRCMDSDLI